ncbi:hypothetical protein [Arcobacter aquimarinus]|uniref:hypothetical protein n=1 Tax=Arcobacter aquimarinus TaxID=1315211 RepID=UPI003BB07154
MYIKSIFKQINENQPAKFYRDELKSICKLNLRRNSKFNIMSIYGALNCLKDIKYKENLSIYIASEYGCVEDLVKVLEQINDEDSMLMPFDFLNVNTNNTGFLVAQALNTLGNNVNISSEDLSFEKAFELAYFEFTTKNIKDILIGGVDESVENICNHNSIIHNLENFISKDGSSWIYINDEKENSIAKIESFDFFTNIQELNKHLQTLDYDNVGLNQYAKKYQSELEINKNLIFKNQDNFYGTTSASDIIDILNENKNSSIYISLDSKKRAYLFYFTNTK